VSEQAWNEIGISYRCLALWVLPAIAFRKEHQTQSGKKERILLSMILVRNQIRDMIGREIGKLTFGRIKRTFRFEQKECQSVYEIFVHWGGRRPQRFCSVSDSVCLLEGFGSLWAKGCDHIAVFTPCNSNILGSFRPHINWTAVMCPTSEVLVKLDEAGFGDNFCLTLVREVARKDWDDNRDVFDKICLQRWI